MAFVSARPPHWTSSIFHYRNQGRRDVGRIVGVSGGRWRTRRLAGRSSPGTGLPPLGDGKSRRCLFSGPPHPPIPVGGPEPEQWPLRLPASSAGEGRCRAARRGANQPVPKRHGCHKGLGAPHQAGRGRCSISLARCRLEAIFLPQRQAMASRAAEIASRDRQDVVDRQEVELALITLELAATPTATRPGDQPGGPAHSLQLRERPADSGVRICFPSTETPPPCAPCPIA